MKPLTKHEIYCNRKYNKVFEVDKSEEIAQ